MRTIEKLLIVTLRCDVCEEPTSKKFQQKISNRRMNDNRGIEQFEVSSLKESNQEAVYSGWFFKDGFYYCPLCTQEILQSDEEDDLANWNEKE